jgi:dTDP-4-amino-4,6-dideoxygalactose transaminase
LWQYDVTKPGFKYNMTDIQAALGLIQLRRLDAAHKRRGEIASRYADGLAQHEEIELPSKSDAAEHSWHIYAIRLCLDRLTISRNRFIDELSKMNIGTSVHFIPLHLLSYYRDKYGYRPDDFPVATTEFSRLISLPLHTRMTDQDVDDVIEAVGSIAKRYRR